MDLSQTLKDWLNQTPEATDNYNRSAAKDGHAACALFENQPIKVLRLSKQQAFIQCESGHTLSIDRSQLELLS